MGSTGSQTSTASSSGTTGASGSTGNPDPVVTCGAPGNPGVLNSTGVNGHNPYKNLYFGNLHQHTALSLDAYTWGTQLLPSQAYAFANGASAPHTRPDATGVDGGVPSVLIASGASAPGPRVYPQRSLDFLAITDHSEWLQVMEGCHQGNLSCPAQDSFDGVPPANRVAEADCACAPGTGVCPGDGGLSMNATCAADYADSWSGPNGLIAAAANAYDPCYFTSLVGYEWTGSDEATGEVINHRNVIFNNDTQGNLPTEPCDSLYCSELPPGLWANLNATCTGACEAVTIPHNTNQSSAGSLLAWEADPADQIKYQVAAEIYQHKGNSECFAGSGTLSSVLGPTGTEYGLTYPSNPDTACDFEKINSPGSDLPLSYVRGGLESGLAIAAAAGVGQSSNPLKLGIAGGTDDHNATPGYVEEEVFAGHHGSLDDTPAKRLARPAPNDPNDYRTFGSGGLTGVWAEQNTRDRIFAAIQRREMFATSGPRLKVRFFQTTLTSHDGNYGCDDPNFPEQIVDIDGGPGGIPMGGTFTPLNLSGAANATFVVKAVSDTYAQIGPSNDGGACSESRDCPGGMTCCPPSGGTPGCTGFGGTARACQGPVPLLKVEVIKAHSSLAGDGGVITVEDAPYEVAPIDPGSTFCGGWTDTHFRADEYSFYYVRVIQVPTYRWSHWDCLEQGMPAQCVDGGIPDQIKERAWTSPIWYSPQ